MKNILTLLLICLFTFSCSDKLSVSKVENIVNECLEKSPKYGEADLYSGTTPRYSSENLRKYQDLQKNGYLKLENKEYQRRWYTEKYQEITLSDKSKPYIITTEETAGSNTKTNIVKLYTLKLDKVGAIREIPARNIAEVEVTYIKENKTPLYDFMETDKTNYISRIIRLKKTENNGWIYCE